MSACDVRHKSSQRGCHRWRVDLAPQSLRRGHASGHQSHRCALDIALDARHLAGKPHARIGLQPQLPIQQDRGVDERVAVNAAEPRELRVLEAGDHAEDFRLRAVLQLRLEADHVPQRAQLVVLPQLHHGPRLHTRIMRISQPDRLHRTIAQRLRPALRHHLDRQAAFEIGRALPLLELRLRSREQCRDERLVLLLGHRTVDVRLGAIATRPRLVIARLLPRLAHVDRFKMHDRCDRIEERQRCLVRLREDRLRQLVRRQRPRRDDHATPAFRRPTVHFAALDRHQRVRLQRRRDVGGKRVAVHRQRRASRHAMPVAHGDDQPASPPHLFVQQPHRIVFPVIRPERVGAHQFREPVRMVSISPPHRPHFVQHHGHAEIGRLPGRLRPRHAAADDVYGFACHGAPIVQFPGGMTEGNRDRL